MNDGKCQMCQWYEARIDKTIEAISNAIGDKDFSTADTFGRKLNSYHESLSAHEKYFHPGSPRDIVALEERTTW